MGSKKKKVLFVIDTLEIGGAEQSLLENAIRFNEIIPIICHLYRGETLKSKFIEHNITVYSGNIDLNYGFLRACKVLSDVVRKEEPSLLVAYLTRSELVSRVIATKFSIPVVGTFVSDLYSDQYNKALPWSSKLKLRTFKLINRLSAKACCGFIANSEGVKASNSKHLGIKKNKIHVIHRGRSSEKFLFKNNHQSKDAVLRFLNIGRLYPVKGQKELILAFKEFTSIENNSFLDIIGEGPSRVELEEIIEQNGLQNKVRLLGARYDIPDLIHNYSCFVFPSHSEGFSGSVIEAMFSGLPVLASNISANREAIQHLVNGYLFERGSVSAIVEAMCWYSKNLALAQSFAKSAKAHADQKFELKNIAIKLEERLLLQIKE